MTDRRVHYSIGEIKIVFVIKPRSFMHDYIALNWVEPEESKRFGIRRNQVFVREDWWKNEAKRTRITVHESVEIFLRLTFKLSYQQAHHLATLAEHTEIKNKGWRLDGVVKHTRKPSIDLT